MNTTETNYQQNNSQAELSAELQRMLVDVKRKLKPESKNELIRIIGALLLDNYALKLQIAELQPKPESDEKNEPIA